jgi:hypothetical protein
MTTKAVVPHSAALEQFEEALETIPWAGDSSNSTEAVLAMIEQIFSETEPDKVLGGSGAKSLGDLAGDDILITGVVKRASDYQKGAYIQMTAIVQSGFDGDTGEEILVSTGATKVIAKVARLHQLGKLPFKARVFEGTAKESGNRFYDLLPVE